MITNRDETRLPLASLPRPITSSLLRCCCCCCYCPLIHIPLDWLLCETLNAKSEQNNTCSINASAGCQLAGSQFPLAASLPPHSLPTPRMSGNLLKNIKKPAPRVNEKRTRTDEARLGSFVELRVANLRFAVSHDLHRSRIRGPARAATRGSAAKNQKKKRDKKPHMQIIEISFFGLSKY